MSRTRRLAAALVAGTCLLALGPVVPGAPAREHKSRGKTAAQPNEPLAWASNPDGPQASAEATLRVVLVGFRPGEVDERAVFADLPDRQQPGVLIPRGASGQPDGSIGPGGVATALSNELSEKRVAYVQRQPVLAPYEYRWRTQLVHAPTAMADGLFATMARHSTTGDFAAAQYREYLERYNAQRGHYRGAGRIVRPGAPVRFVEAEKVEDWLAANAGRHLGPEPQGYTVYVLNTWDAPEATRHLPPAEYHVFRIGRTNPDSGGFEGIDWARLWGGRHRFLMVDAGAAPNGYESETFYTRGRSVLGSAAGDPPLWEMRARSTRPFDRRGVTETGGGDVVTPTATNELTPWLARLVTEAASYKFLHSYLYEPWPATGRFWLAANIWHDAKAATPFPSDLKKLYNHDLVLKGLRTLVPYLAFDGDTEFKDLSQPGPSHTADQAALDAAKAAGNHTAMNVYTAMAHVDRNAARLRRPRPCYTSIPSLNVVAEKHYAWVNPVVAGVATNSGGVPWGYLASVNDVFRWRGADKGPTSAAHALQPRGTFSYTTLHEASHSLGLAHPHDTIGASRGPNGEPRYWMGFRWAFDTTAAPTTYSHSELEYAVLDQENIARGHGSYYLQWADSALGDGDDAYLQRGLDTVRQLPRASAEARAEAIARLREARRQFAAFDFVTAASTAGRSWAAGAAYLDRAKGDPPGTAEAAKGTNEGGACRSR